MAAAELLEVIRLVNSALTVARNFGVNIDELQRMIDEAQSEGRDLSEDELQQLADEAQAAVDRL